ncbi:MULTISPECIES: class I SAM-dependent methyltransferase [unclassified Rhodococcus (in: high G+C Gram-positive bacteria)]|uniref:class I SAM-dependent methyltransferase n=1 Tax=unclassified Rhodococcus (in: high G+C Gram-positive bacteria) TaxID=192944 RepID=UPI001445E74F|nr:MULTISPECIES: class I SAM-dependent methyltransferase [unclassified Rhodococcus (in: high G+C Gram-positive bacteria)]
MLLDDLRAERRGAVALAGLEPESYARDHAAFEQLSDQRGLIAEHLASRLARVGDGPVSILSVGCGDGSLDARLAKGLVLAVPGRPVRYVGIEPWSGSARLFTANMAALEADELDVDVHVASFSDAPADETFDVVLFVHSIYYVADLEETLRGAIDLLRPGGELWVLNAPRAALNALVDVLAPPLEGHRQWFSADVEKAFVDAGIALDEVVTLDALVDLASASERVLDFAVQARLTPELRGPVRAYLDAVSVPGADGRPRVPHPVDVFAAARR